MTPTTSTVSYSPSPLTRAAKRRKGHRFFAAFYDKASATAEAGWLAPQRAELLRTATGVVIDVGAGTGLNLRHLPGDLEAVHLVEPDPHMLRRLRERAPATARISQATAEDLPFATNAVDTVVFTLTLCSVSDVTRALSEARRVLRPGGRLLVLEHVRSTDAQVAAAQDRYAPLWRKLAGGCSPNRDVASALNDTGFDTSRLYRSEGPGLRLGREYLLGTAQPLAD